MKKTKMNIVKQVSFSKPLLEFAEERTQTLGIGFPEYIRYLVLQDRKERTRELPLVTEAEESSIARALEEEKREEFVKLKSDKEVEDFLTKIAEK